MSLELTKDGEGSVSEVVYEGPSARRVSRIKVCPNDVVRKGQILILFDTLPDQMKPGTLGDKGKIKAMDVGAITEVLVKSGDIVQTGTCLLRMRKGCPHATVMKDMCAECGADLRKNGLPGIRQGTVEAAVPIVHNIPELYVSNEHAMQLGKADVDVLLKSKRLVLLVDLDQTLIHTTAENISADIKDIHHFQLSPKYAWYHTKLRPGTMEFLSGIRKYFELHICTFGTRMYAHQIAKILDPDGALFSHRILSRDEILDPFLKTANMKALFPLGDQMVCIIDDREDVWSFSSNLVHVKPYSYFKNVGDINAPFPKSITNVSPASTKDISSVDTKLPSEAIKHQYESQQFGDQSADTDSDDYLLYLKSILVTIHSAYYQLYDEMIAAVDDKNGTPKNVEIPDLKNIVPYVRKKVLKGCSLVFSGLFPQDVRSEEKERATALARSFGATVSEDILTRDISPDGFTTHVIAVKEGTAKVTKARQLGNIHVVGPAWLKECIRRWERVEERLYPLPLPSNNSSAHASFLSESNLRHPPSNVSSGNDSVGVNCLSGISAVDLENMNHEVDDEIGDLDLDDSDSITDDSKDIIEKGDEKEDEEEADETASLNDSLDEHEHTHTSRKRLHSPDSDDENSDIVPKQSRNDRLSGPSDDENDVEEKESFSDEEDDSNEEDESDLGEMAAELERQLSEN